MGRSPIDTPTRSYSESVKADRANLKHDLHFVNQMLNTWDFIGVADEVDDEYNCLVPTLTRLLVADADSAEIVRYLRNEINDHFGMKDLVKQRDIEEFVALLGTRWHARHDV